MSRIQGGRSTVRGCALGLISIGLLPGALASNHSDAPLIKQDPQANLTDVYAFVGTRYDDASQRVLNVVISVRPFSEPGDGVIYDRFADDVRYSIHITDPVSGETKLRYDFYFSAVNSGFKNPDTILSYGLGTEAGPIQSVDDGRQNYTQTYRVERVEGRHGRVVGRDLLTPPPNVGKNVTPFYNDAEGKAVSGATTLDELDVYTRSTIYGLSSGEVVWAGHRDDSFFCDIPGIFDLLDIRILDNNGDLSDGLGQDGNGVDGFKGFNVLTIAMQVPISELDAREIPRAYDTVFFGEQTGVGVYASTSRPRISIRKSDGSRQNIGGWMQVQRLGNPFFNEGLVALRDKDRFNRASPTDDATFATYALNPELASLINFVFQTDFAATDRTDLAGIFIPEVLKVVTTTDPVRLSGQSGFHRFGFIGGDTTNGVSGGWPNGRRLGDDVADIALTAIASGPSYSTITIVGDNVPANDLPYHQVFPYIATPHAGSNNRKDPGN
jgi:hypothetical protein